jgi:hypothetical protein
MTLAISDKTGIDRQRGYRLRCFLGWACIVALLSVAATGLLWAKVEERGPMHLWRLRGFYMDAKGEPIGNVEVALVRDGIVRYRTRTDGAGRFAFEHVAGRYRMQIEKASDHSLLSRDVIVGLETATILARKTLYIIAGPAACTDDCSSVYTNKSDFEKTVRRNTGHQD